MSLYGPPSLLICSIFEIACSGEVLSQPPRYLQPPLRANRDVKYESTQWLRFAGDSNSSILYVEDTKYFRKLSNAPGNICVPSAFGIQIGCVSVSCLDTFNSTGF